MNTETLPAFFSTVKLPSVAQWAANKVKSLPVDKFDIDGCKITASTWAFEGEFARNIPCESLEWRDEKNGKQYGLLIVRASQKSARYQIAFKEYASADGTPIPE